jgi:hypothetical protein
LTTSSASSASIARRAVLAVAILPIAIGPVPAIAGLTFSQLNSIENERIANANVGHQSVLKEIGYERAMADKKLADQLKICTTAKCKAVQRADDLRTQSQLDVQEEHENATYAAKIAQIKADIAAEEKATGAAPKPH